MEKDIFNINQGIGYFCGAGLGEAMQYLSAEKIINYNWLTGHLSDIALPAQITSLGLVLSSVFCKNNKYLNLASTLIPPTLSCMDELKILNLNPISKTYDSQDIACFFAGSLMAYGLSKANEKKVFSKMSNKMKNMFNKKTLENLAKQ